MRRKRVSFLLASLLLVIVSACVETPCPTCPPTPNVKATETAIAQSVIATITAEASIPSEKPSEKPPAPACVSWRDTGQHVGEVTCVEGTVVLASYRPDVRGQPTFLNFHDPYQGYFTVVIWGDDRGKFPQAPDKMFLHKKVRVEGLIEEYKGSPEIVVREPAQIEIVQ